MTQNHASLRPCPVCHSHSGNVLARLTYALFDDLALTGTKTLICCDNCGMLFDDVAFTEDQLQEYYRCNEHYAVSGLGGGGGISDDNNERYDKIIDTLNPGVDDLILDYGCGQGGLIARCRQRGLKAVGIEPSEKSRNVGRNFGLQIYESMAPLIAHKPLPKIQTIVFSHVLEHVMNPLQLIRTFAPYAEDALVYMEVPDADSYLSPEAVKWPEMYFEHLSHFRKQHLAELACHSGIEILKEDKVPFSKELSNTRCLALVGRFSGKMKKEDANKLVNYHPVSVLPPLAVDNMPPDDRPLALWGVSQYAMLLLGSCPRLAGRVDRLFDASPAKIGRRIKGITIESSENLSTLPGNTTLLIPKSNFLPQMRRQLNITGFRGKVLEV